MQGSKKIALVTGANKSIGFEVARQIAKAGWTVVVAARREELGQAAVAKLRADGLDVHFVRLDLNDHKTAAIAAESIRTQFGKLDVLVNNAGISGKADGPPSETSLSDVEAIMHTNFVGSVAVTQAMLPLLQQAGNAQIINVSSELGCISRQTDPTWKFFPVKVLGYCASKAALNMLTVQLAYEFRDSHISVNSVNPGYTATDLNGHSGPQTVEEGAAEIVRLALLDAPPTGKFLETGGELAW
jgi:NAD(P)-dependent dehydrogenase (short-subunit alcohol dehydrogenase family)